MNRFKTFIASLTILAVSALPALANIPWGDPGNVTLANSQVNGATPTCTYSATLFTCLERMTAPVTSLTLAGMTAGSYYSLIWMQDGTGSRALTQTPITGAPALTTAESAANGYAVWVIKATSASAATFVTDYPNASIATGFNMTQAGAGTTVTAATIQAQTVVYVPGMTANSWCDCVFTNPDTNFNKGMSMGCVPATNTVTCNEINATAANATPTAGTIRIQVAQ